MTVAAVPESLTTDGVRETFDSVDPATGEVVGTWPVHGADEVSAAVARAREAAQWWAGLDHAVRARHLGAWKATIARRIHELADLVAAAAKRRREPDDLAARVDDRAAVPRFAI